MKKSLKMLLAAVVLINAGVAVAVGVNSKPHKYTQEEIYQMKKDAIAQCEKVDGWLAIVKEGMK